MFHPSVLFFFVSFLFCDATRTFFSLKKRERERERRKKTKQKHGSFFLAVPLVLDDDDDDDDDVEPTVAEKVFKER